jgi:hypothetical protein
MISSEWVSLLQKAQTNLMTTHLALPFATTAPGTSSAENTKDALLNDSREKIRQLLALPENAVCADCSAPSALPLLTSLLLPSSSYPSSSFS